MPESPTANALLSGVSPDAPAPAGFQLPCPACGTRDAHFSVRLAGLDGDDALYCGECECEFSIDEMRERVREMQARWQPVLSWLSIAPSFPEPDQE